MCVGYVSARSEPGLLRFCPQPLSPNPADVVRPKRLREAARDTTPKAWTEEEVRKFYRVAQQDRRGLLFCFMLAIGMYPGEALGRRWENVEITTGQVNIHEQMVSINGRAHRTTPKTARSRRTVTVSDDPLAILREMPTQVALDREVTGRRYVGSDAVFTAVRVCPILSDNVCEQMDALCKQAGVPHRGTHVLRDSFISIQGMLGRPVEVVSTHVGHATPSFTMNRYRSVYATERAALTLNFTQNLAPSESPL